MNVKMSSGDYVFKREYFETCDAPHWFKNNRAKYRARRADILRLVEPDVSAVLVEFGCSRGDTAFHLAPYFRRVVAVDHAEAAIQICRERMGQSRPPNIEFVLADAADCPVIPDDLADRVLAADLVEHLLDHVFLGVCAEASRVLKPGGTFSIYTPCATHYVERMRALHLLPRIIDHVAVRRANRILGLLRSSPSPLQLDALWYSPSCYPLFGLLDRLLIGAPALGILFRHKICLRLCKPTTSGGPHA